MKKFLRGVLVLVVLGVSANYAYAQHHVNVHTGVSLPMGDFANDDINNEGAAGAATGFNLGGQYSYQFADFGLGVFAGIDINYNPLTKKYRDKIFEYYQSEGLYGTEQDFYEYLNVPTTMGLHYYLKANESFGLLFNGGMAINLLQMTNYEVKYQNYTITTYFDPAYSIGYKLGGGIIIREKFTLMVDYLNLGTIDIEGEIEALGQENEKVSGKEKVSLLNIAAGYRF